jgi:hypothetical protein
MAASTAFSSFNTNSRIGTTSNLPSGATYDLLLLNFPDGFPQSQLLFEIGTEPRKITGVQKVAQVFLKILFTSKGIDPFYPTQGTYFTSYTVNANKVTSDATLYSDIIACINDATSQTQYILNTQGSDIASQLASMTVLGLDVGDESIVMYLSMVTNAGVSATIATPFPLLDLPLSS